MALPRFRALPHTADLRLVVWGADLDEILGSAVAGALSLALGRPPRGLAHDWTTVERWPRGPGERIVRLVNEALFLLYARRQIAVAVQVGTRSARLGTRPLGRRGTLVEVKAATFHDLAVERCARGLRARLVLDA